MSLYSQLKSQARQESAEMDRCFQQSQSAYAGGDFAAANSLSAQGKAHQANRDALHAQADALIATPTSRRAKFFGQDSGKKSHGKGGTLRSGKARSNWSPVEDDIFAKGEFREAAENAILFVVGHASKLWDGFRAYGKTAVGHVSKQWDRFQTYRRIDRPYAKISRNGHAVQRHGEHITEAQLDLRVLFGIDPVTGTTSDAFNKDTAGNPKPHVSSKTASKFSTKQSLVLAAQYVGSSQEYRKALIDVEATADDYMTVEGIRLEAIYGAYSRSAVFGKTRTGTRKAPTASIETDFIGGTITAKFSKNTDGSWILDTMFPEPPPTP